MGAVGVGLDIGAIGLEEAAAWLGPRIGAVVLPAAVGVTVGFGLWVSGVFNPRTGENGGGTEVPRVGGGGPETIITGWGSVTGGTAQSLLSVSSLPGGLNGDLGFAEFHLIPRRLRTPLIRNVVCGAALAAGLIVYTWALSTSRAQQTGPNYLPGLSQFDPKAAVYSLFGLAGCLIAFGPTG